MQKQKANKLWKWIIRVDTQGVPVFLTKQQRKNFLYELNEMIMNGSVAWKFFLV